MIFGWTFLKTRANQQSSAPARLPGDMTLSFHSISALHGHYGEEVVYQPSLHRAYRRSYGVTVRCFLKKETNHTEFRDIPVSLTDPDEVKAFLRSEAGWPLR